MVTDFKIAGDYKLFLRSVTRDNTAVRLIFRKIFKLFQKHYILKENKIISYEISTETAWISYHEMGLKNEAIGLALLWYPYFNDPQFKEDCQEILTEEMKVWLNEAEKIEQIDPLNLLNQPDSYLKLILNLTGDIRVLLIRLAQYIAVLRKLPADSPAAMPYAQTAYHIYAPILHQLGLYSLNHEILDNSFAILHPDEFGYISSRLEQSTVKRNEYIEQFCRPLRDALGAAGLSFELKWRTKSVHSIWRKMKVQHVGFDQVYDIFAIRIILNVEKSKEKEACWLAYSLVTSIYEPNLSRLRDWITQPKVSGYESLHITVLGPQKQWVEVQIRSSRMDMIAEKGLAAHWKYKGIKTDKSYEEWLNSLREILEKPDKSLLDALTGINKQVVTDDVFVFTPKSELKKLKKGSTVLDFAFDLHTEIGCRCTGAKVNNRIVPLRYVLQNGDRIEIMTSRNQKPTKDWLNIVVSGKAKTKIKRWLTEEQHKFAERGKEILKRKLKKWKIEFNELNINPLLEYFKLPHVLDLYSGIADGNIDLTEIKAVLTETRSVSVEKALVSRPEKAKPPASPEMLIIDPALKNTTYHLAKCCNPIPGDPIFGFITVDKGITIHHQDCPNASFLLTNYPYRRIEAKWASDLKAYNFEVEILVKGQDKMGVASKLTTLISKTFGVNISAINVESIQNEFSAFFRLQVMNSEQLTQLMSRLKKIKEVKSVQRIEKI